MRCVERYRPAVVSTPLKIPLLHSLFVASFALASLYARAAAPGKVDFNRDVRPILSDTCFACHGPDEAKRKSGLRLDNKDDAFKPAKSGETAIVPGKPDASELVKRVLTDDADEHMPPKKSEKTIKPAQIEVLKKWIAEGAEYQGHWAFVKPERPVVPALSANPIDAFILDRLAREGLQPSPEAPRETLIRRVSLDLTGIPPSPEEVDAFVADQSPNAFEKIVDRLLASPRYGEQMAVQWLDLARYADSNGFQIDSSRQQHHWRGWVIGAFNRNLPFDQFTIEQLAGDLLPNAAPEQIAATGFNRNHRLNGEGGRIVEEWFAETVIDRVETTGATWMALTLGCCRCHDHKFDPVTQKEFYQFFAFFNSIDESGVLDGESTNTKPILRMPKPEQAARLDELDKSIAAANAEMQTAEKNVPAAQAAWELALGPAPAGQQWVVLPPEQLKSSGGALLATEPDGVVFASGPQPATDIYTITCSTDLVVVSAVKVELLPDDRLPSKGPGRHPNGNPVLSEVSVKISPRAGGGETPVVLRAALADFSQEGYPVANAIDKNPGTGWALYPQVGQAHEGVFAFDKPVAQAGGAKIEIVLDQNFGSGATIGKFRVSATSAPEPVPLPADVGAVLAAPAAQRDAAQLKKLADYFRTRAPELLTAKGKLDVLTKERATLDGAVATIMVMKEIAQPREAHILKRGEYDKPGDKVERGLPAALPPLPPGTPMNRLGLAQWLVSGEHPLTARVWVNRAWERFFGTGLVKTSENFGSQAEWPSHPELLDWLATEFVRLKWDMKAMQKAIVMSAAYRQSSRVTPQLMERDPDNRLLARGPRFRLTAEMLRDQALAVSGLLVEKLGGPSVRPYMPAGVWDETSVYGDLRGYKNDTDEGLYRRTLYTIWKRTAAPPTMQIFDSPTREVCTVKRSRTNTPLQALALLNEVTYVEAARRLAERMLTEGGTMPEQRLAWGFRRVTCRTPDADEIKVLVAGVEKRLTKFRQHADAAKQLIAFGEAKPRAGLDPAELAAYATAANVILNLDEAVTRE